MDRYIDVKEAGENLTRLVEQAGRGSRVVITCGGQPVARLEAMNTSPAHRAKESRRTVTLPAAFEASDARLARLARDGDVPRAWRELPRH